MVVYQNWFLGDQRREKQVETHAIPMRYKLLRLIASLSLETSNEFQSLDISDDGESTYRPRGSAIAQRLRGERTASTHPASRTPVSLSLPSPSWCKWHAAAQPGFLILNE